MIEPSTTSNESACAETPSFTVSVDEPSTTRRRISYTPLTLEVPATSDVPPVLSNDTAPPGPIASCSTPDSVPCTVRVTDVTVSRVGVTSSPPASTITFAPESSCESLR